MIERRYKELCGKCQKAYVNEKKAEIMEMSKTMSIYKIAKLLDIPKSTLHDFMSENKSKRPNDSGRPINNQKVNQYSEKTDNPS